MLNAGGIPLRAFLAVAAVVCLGAVVATSEARPLGVHTGYAPEQPIDFSHRLHAGELGVDCLYCHFGARTSKVAGIPPTSTCMRCHTTVSTGFDATLAERDLALREQREPRRLVSPEVAKIWRAMGLDEQLAPLPEGPAPIRWVKVHNLPDFVAFDHSVHVARGLSCQTCHGPVQAMERVRQESDLSMGWCLDCHRTQGVRPGIALQAGAARLPPDEHVSTDCASCHY